MDPFTAILRMIGGLTAMAAFGLTFCGALASHVDPLSALLRGVAASIAIATAYSLVCHTLVPIFTMKTPTEENGGEQHPGQ